MPLMLLTCGIGGFILIIMEKIISQEQLDKLINESSDGILDCFVVLNGGARSSKYITFDDDSYYIYNEIDGSEDIIKHNKLMDSFPIGEAIKKGALYSY